MKESKQKQTKGIEDYGKQLVQSNAFFKKVIVKKCPSTFELKKNARLITENINEINI